MARIEAPNRDYKGPGPGGAVFVDGVAETDDEAALNYYRGAGYTVDGDTLDVDGPDVPDARDVTEVLVGSPLRDAAVDPKPTDFLPPIGAGEGDPHGPTVVSPEVHASGPAGIRPGVVYVDDNGKQEAREAAYADTRLIEGVPAGEAVATEIPEQAERGQLGLSDPGSAAVGESTDSGDAAEGSLGGDADDESASPPRQADPKAAWVDYAVAAGTDRDEAEGMTKTELIDRFGEH